jgi:hypothetical protein
MAAVKNITRTKAYKDVLSVLVAAGIDPEVAASKAREKALAAHGMTEANDMDARVAKLIEAGISKAEAIELLTGTVAAEVEDDRSEGERLVEQNSLAFTKGRVYVTGSILEVAARVLKTGSPEIARTSGKGRVAAVLVQREESGDVSIQNLATPKA